MPNNVVREQQLQSVASVAKNFILFELVNINVPNGNNVLDTVSENSVTLLTIAQADSLNAEDKETFLNEYTAAQKISNGWIHDFHWIDITEEYKDGTWFYMRYEFSAPGRNGLNTVCTINGFPMKVVEVSADEFYAKLTEFGVLAIIYLTEE